MFPNIFFGTHKSPGFRQGCLPCTAGSFADTEGLSTCKPCPNGSQQDQTGQSFCPPAASFLDAPGQLVVFSLCLYISRKQKRSLKKSTNHQFLGSMSVFGGVVLFTGPFQHQILCLSFLFCNFDT